MMDEDDLSVPAPHFVESAGTKENTGKGRNINHGSFVTGFVFWN